jgi:RNA polymerase sigma-70 factor, ECF subfamily
MSSPALITPAPDAPATFGEVTARALPCGGDGGASSGRSRVTASGGMSAPALVLDADLRAFQAVRPRLFGIAYRILGNAADADDIVQDTWIRWQQADRRMVRNAPAFLATTTTRLAINAIQSARARHETVLSDSVPEPIDPGADPTLRLERREALERGVSLLVEKLSPAERRAYVLREALDYPYRQVGQTLGLTECNARQLAARGRMRLREAAIAA